MQCDHKPGIRPSSVDSCQQPRNRARPNDIRSVATIAEQFAYRASGLTRLPRTRETFLKPDGSPYRPAETFRQPRPAATLRVVASQGAAYRYEWASGQRLVSAIRGDGGKMSLEDLRPYQVIWADPLVASIGDCHSVRTSRLPSNWCPFKSKQL
jgi:gamma-glutamyltranspeptidase / glutathione hydrolase